jgi:hypothetical protein
MRGEILEGSPQKTQKRTQKAQRKKEYRKQNSEDRIKYFRIHSVTRTAVPLMSESAGFSMMASVGSSPETTSTSAPKSQPP